MNPLGMDPMHGSEVFDLLDEGVIVHAPDGTVLSCSAGAERILGMPANQLAGRRGLFSSLEAVSEGGTLLTPDSEPAREALRTRRPTLARRLRIRRPDGGPAWLQVRATPMTAPRAAVDGGRVAAGALTFVQDLGEQAMLEQQLQGAVPEDAFGRIAGSVAHDFNHFLTVILGHAELLYDALPADSGMRENASQVREAAVLATGLTRELIDFSRRQQPASDRVDLAPTLAAMQPMLARLLGPNVRLRLALDPGLPPVRANAPQLERVILNLALNARDAMRDRGELRIEMRMVDLDTAFVRRNPGSQVGTFVRIGVRDDGVGMDAATRARLFEPFFTTKPQGQGTGLGLTAVYGIVKQFGGYIGVESAPGNGAEFRIDLPLYDADPRESATGQAGRRRRRAPEAHDEEPGARAS